MQFKTPRIEREWPNLHPAVRSVIETVESRLTEWKLPTLTITDIGRTPGKQEELYWKDFVSMGFTEKLARQKARAKFSWHLVDCAVDFRGSEPWGRENELRLLQWLKKSLSPAHKWEVLFHNAGTGQHFHLAVKDSGRWERWELNKGQV